MNDNSWTAGPWRLNEPGEKCDSRNQVCEVAAHARILCDGELGTTLGDAHLIAAAPDLYEALEAIIEENWADVRLPVHLLEQAEAALAKARGETA